MKYFIQAFVRKLGFLAAGALFAFCVTYCSDSHAIEYQVAGMANQPTPKAACEAFDAVSSAQDWFWQVGPPTVGTCRRPSGQTTPISIIGSCGANDTITYSTTDGHLICTAPPVTCTPPLVRDPATNTCVADCMPLKGSRASYSSNIAASSSCIEGCTVIVADGHCGKNAAGQLGCFYDGDYTGASCAGSPAPVAPNTPEFDCIKQGKSYGVVSGVIVCIPPTTAGAPPVTTTNNGSTSTTTPAGTTSTSTSTSVTNNTVTTTTTTTAPNGTQTTESKEQDKTSFCEQNPNSPMCKAAEDLCEKNPDIPACKEWCDKPENDNKLACMEEGDDLTDTKDDLGTDQVDFNIAPIGGIPSMSGCPVPDSVNVGPVTIPLSYDWLCTYAAAFKFLVLIFSWIGAAYIVYNASIKD